MSSRRPHEPGRQAGRAVTCDAFIYRPGPAAFVALTQRHGRRFDA